MDKEEGPRTATQLVGNLSPAVETEEINHVEIEESN